MNISPTKTKFLKLVLATCLLGPLALHAEPPQYGGELNIGTVYVTLSPLSWDPQDWNWKSNHDTSMVREQLFSANLDMSVKKGGPHLFVSDAYIPADAIRGELAESWQWTDPLTLELKLRRGVIIPAKAGVMQRRELDAHDVVFSFNNLQASAKKINNYLDHIREIEVVDSHTLRFHFSEFNAEWDYRFGYGYYSAIVPRETANKPAQTKTTTVKARPVRPIFQLTQTTASTRFESASIPENAPAQSQHTIATAAVRFAINENTDSQ